MRKEGIDPGLSCPNLPEANLRPPGLVIDDLCHCLELLNVANASVPQLFGFGRVDLAAEIVQIRRVGTLRAPDGRYGPRSLGDTRPAHKGPACFPFGLSAVLRQIR